MFPLEEARAFLETNRQIAVEIHGTMLAEGPLGGGWTSTLLEP